MERKEKKIRFWEDIQKAQLSELGEMAASAEGYRLGEREMEVLERRREELVRVLARARAEGEDDGCAGQELVSVCEKLEAENELNLGRLPPEMWAKVTDHFENDDLFAFAMTCGFFRKAQQELCGRAKRELRTSRSAFEQAAADGDLEKLRWLRREGYEWEGTHDWDDDYFGGRLF